MEVRRACSVNKLYNKNHVFERCWCLLAFSCSIGGDKTLESVTTLPSEFMPLVWLKKTKQFVWVTLSDKNTNVSYIMPQWSILFGNSIRHNVGQFLNSGPLQESHTLACTSHLTFVQAAQCLLFLRHTSNMTFLTGNHYNLSLHWLSVDQLKGCNVAEEETLTASVTETSGALPFLFLSSDILRKFNPSLKGFSKGQGSRQKGFNMAVAGAKTSYVHFLFSSSTWVKLLNEPMSFQRLSPVFVPWQRDPSTSPSSHQGNDRK